MNGHQKRLRAVEVTLTPSQVVRLWIKNAITGAYEEGATHFPSPRTLIANSVARIVRTALNGETEDIIERGILQARQEADTLYFLAVELNGQIHSHYFETEREFTLLLAYFAATMGCSLESISEEQLRKVTLFFVSPILALQGAICRISTERFEGQPVLFSDSVARLQEQLHSVDEALEIYSSIAEKANFGELTKEQICESLRSKIDQQTARLLLVARGEMLASFGEPLDFRKNLRELAATYAPQETSDETK